MSAESAPEARRAELLQAVLAHQDGQVQPLLERGADPNTRDPANGLTVLMIAAGQDRPEIVDRLLRAGADPCAVDSLAGSTALHKACQGGSLESARLLVEAGAFVDAVAVTTGHTPLIEAIWFKWPEIVDYLLGRGAGLNINTHYGFTLQQHLQYALNVNQIGQDKLQRAADLVARRRDSDQGAVEAQRLMAAVVAKDLSRVRQLLEDGAAVDQRAPVLNGFNDEHTPLLVASRDGPVEIVSELLKAGAEVNAVEPTFGAVPLHKAVYNGHADITRVLVGWPGADLDFQGYTNGYTPLLDSLWHGFEECSTILIEAGARLDLFGHDGKQPLDLALQVFGESHPVVQAIRARA